MKYTCRSVVKKIRLPFLFTPDLTPGLFREFYHSFRSAFTDKDRIVRANRFLPRDAMLQRQLIRYCHMSLLPSVGSSVTSWCSVKTAKRRTMETPRTIA